MAQPDTYECFADLAAHKTEGTDYLISDDYKSSEICVIGPHGGGIELGVSELVRAIARDEFSFYLFEGIQRSKNRELHITSHHFDEPRARALVAEHYFAVSIHGEESEDLATTYIGGNNPTGRRLLGDLLRRSKFDVAGSTPFHLRGEQVENICNGCISGQGLQVEITWRQRNEFFRGLRSRAGRKWQTGAFVQYVQTLRAALGQLKREVKRL